ncbi:MAG TPA: hypothetical protein VGD27_11170 [Longimicrobiales bacterium]
MFRRTRISYAVLVAAAALAACSAPGSVTGGADTARPAAMIEGERPQDPQALAQLRQATARFQNFDDAVAAGYSTKVTPCWAHHSAGAMGYHYGNMALFDAKAELLAPEVVMYEPQAGGKLKLVGMEYIVPIDAWAQAGHDTNNVNDRPELLGQKFTQHSSLPIYKLHIWLWRENPTGMFKDWNPKVSCASADSAEVF